MAELDTELDAPVPRGMSTEEVVEASVIVLLDSEVDDAESVVEDEVSTATGSAMAVPSGAVGPAVAASVLVAFENVYGAPSVLEAGM